MGNKPSSDEDESAPRPAGKRLPRQPYHPAPPLSHGPAPKKGEPSEGRKLSRSEKSRQKQQCQQQFHDTLEVVTQLWPELGNLKNVEVKYLEANMTSTLTSVLGKLVQQYNQTRNLLAERHDLLQDIVELQAHAETYQQALHEQTQLMSDLKDDVAILSGELRRRGFAAHLPDRRASAPPEALQGTMADSPSRSYNSSRHDSRRSSTKIPGQDEAIIPLAEKPTLIQLAAHASPRRLSLKKRSQGDDSPVPQTESPPDAFVGELQHRLQDLIIRRPSFKYTDGEPQPEAGQGRKWKTYDKMSREQLVSRYERLESEALTKLLGVLHIYASYTEEGGKRRFLCSVMELAYQYAGEVGHQFLHSIRTLILDPIQSSTLDDGISHEGIRRKSSLGLADLGTSQLKALDRTGLPEHLTEQVRLYVQSTSDTISIAPLQEAVVTALQEASPDLMSAGMLHNAQFEAFLSECCRLAWGMIIMTPPMYISVEKYAGRLDRKLHNILVSDPDNGTDSFNGEPQCVDYYVWPVLHNKKYGDVLHKGTVVCRANRV